MGEDNHRDIVGDDVAAAIVGHVIRELHRARQLQNLSMYRIAKMTRLHPSTISLIERGQRSPSLFVVVKIARALHIPLGPIFNLYDDESLSMEPAPDPSSVYEPSEAEAELV